MASGLYDSFKEALLSQNPSIDLDTDTIKARLVNIGTDYTFDAANHDFINDVTAYNGTTDQTLSNKTVTDGTFDNTATITFSSVNIDGSKDADAVVIYKDTGTATTSPLVCYLEFAASVTPNGGDIIVDWNASGLFAL